MTALLGLDVGTTGARCVAIDEAGRMLAEATAEYPLYSPRPGWSEQNPADWWDASASAIRRVAEEVGPDVAGIGLTGQMHGAVFMDGSDAVIRPALLWNDQRTQKQCDEITRLVGADELIRIAGNPALTGFQAPKLLWLREEEPQAYARMQRLLLPKDYIRLRLHKDLRRISRRVPISVSGDASSDAHALGPRRALAGAQAGFFSARKPRRGKISSANRLITPPSKALGTLTMKYSIPASA